jgi:hypothetical protein
MSKKNSSEKIREAISSLNSCNEQPFIKHQWEEILQQLSQMNDPQLREIAKHEMAHINENNALRIQLSKKPALSGAAAI